MACPRIHRWPVGASSARLLVTRRIRLGHRRCHPVWPILPYPTALVRLVRLPTGGALLGVDRPSNHTSPSTTTVPWTGSLSLPPPLTPLPHRQGVFAAAVHISPVTCLPMMGRHRVGRYQVGRWMSLIIISNSNSNTSSAVAAVTLLPPPEPHLSHSLLCRTFSNTSVLPSGPLALARITPPSTHAYRPHYSSSISLSYPR